jgi:hypothetical protein
LVALLRPPSPDVPLPPPPPPPPPLPLPLQVGAKMRRRAKITARIVRVKEATFRIRPRGCGGDNVDGVTLQLLLLAGRRRG